MIINLKVFNKVEITYVVWACYLPCLGSSHLFRHRKSSIFGVGTTSFVVSPIFFNDELSVKEKKRKRVINTYDFSTKIARLYVAFQDYLMIDSSTCILTDFSELEILFEIANIY